MLKEKLMEDLKEAMKEKQILRKNVVQMIRAAILQVEKDKQIELDDNQMKFNSQTKVINTGGTITDLADGKVNVKDADEVIIITSIATDYKNEYPEYRTGESSDELSERVNKTVIKASKKGFDGLLESHLSDYQGIFSRVDLDLMQTPSSLTTDNLLKKYND